MSPTAQKVLAIVQAFVGEHGRPPLHKEIAHALGHTSAGSVSRSLTELRRAGLIRRGIMHVCAPTPIELAHGDPRHAAWLQHWRNTGRADTAQETDRFRRPITVPAPWPPESPEVELVHGLFYVPPGTPEYASHLALLRKVGRVAQAQAIEVAKKTITPKVRWGTEETAP
jgi:hypothetical protein